MLGAITFLLALAYALSKDLESFVGDDGGITLRYAERIAAGLGFSYNEGEAVNGCSNPLYTLCLATLLRAGLTPHAAVFGFGAAAFALSCGLLFTTLARFRSVGTALVATLALLAFSRPYHRLFIGLEVPLTMLLAVLLFRALHARRTEAVGVVLGLLVANKLDCALAAIAFAGVYVGLHRRFPWRVAGVALATALPVLAWVYVSFGSVLPHSMTVKLLEHADARALDPLWMHRLLETDFRLVYYLALASIVLVPFVRDLRRQMPLLTVQAWFLLHLLAYALIDLGAPYPWYAAVPNVLAPILAIVPLELLAQAVPAPRSAPKRELRRSLVPARGRIAWRLPVFCAGLVLLATSWGSDFAPRAVAKRASDAMPRFAAGDLARQAAGAWLRKHTSGDELLATAYGLPAYEYGGPVYDMSGLNSRRDGERRNAAPYELDGPVSPGRPVRPSRGERALTATFVIDGSSDLYALYAHPESEVARSGAVHLMVPPPRAKVVPAAGGAPSTYAWAHGALEVNAGDSVLIQSDFPLAPELRADVALVDSSDGIAGGANAAARSLVVSVNGERVDTLSLRPGEPARTLAVSAPTRAPDSKYGFELQVEGLDQSSHLALRISRPLLCAGDALEPADFKILWPRGRRHVESSERSARTTEADAP